MNVCDFGGFTCCSSQGETRLYTESFKDLKNTLEDGTREISMILKNQSDKLHSFVLDLIDGAQRSLHTLFFDTYDSTYTDNQDVFIKFFDDLKKYYQGGVIDLADIFDSLFSSLTKLAFKLYQYEINEEYGQCIGDNMHLIQPFADQPKKLENKVERAFVAVKTYSKALERGRVVIENLSKMHPTNDDITEYMRMTHCAKCAGYIVESPCQTFCENTMHDILCSLHGDFSNTWSDYIHAMNSLLTRMKGPFNIDVAISPIDVKISGCIMVLQDHEEPIANAVERACGPLVKANTNTKNGSGLLFPHGFDLTGLSQLGPDLSHSLDLDQANVRTKRSARKSSSRRGQRPVRKKKLRSAHRARDVTSSKRPDISGQIVQPAKSRLGLESLISEMHDTQKRLKAYWRNATNNICANVVGTASSGCWNGKSVVPTDTGNAENMKHCPVGVKAEPTFRHEIHNLKLITLKLRQAFNGIDPAMPDKEVYIENSSGDGSGDDESTESEESETTHSGSSKEQHERNKENVDTNTTPSKDRSQFVNALEDWEIDILEDVLGRPIAKEESLKGLKEAVLQLYPHLKHKRQGKHRIKVAELTENQINRLKKMLGITHETSTNANENDEKTGKEDALGLIEDKPVVTARNEVKTTSAAFGLKSCPLLLLVAFIFIRHPL